MAFYSKPSNENNAQLEFAFEHEVQIEQTGLPSLRRNGRHVTKTCPNCILADNMNSSRDD